jgi:outer membrane lipoprotein-sorting protein
MRRKTFLIALLLVVLPMALSTSAQDDVMRRIKMQGG